jgi:hypothetical protein
MCLFIVKRVTEGKNQEKGGGKMTSGQSVLIVLALIVCFLGFVWLVLRGREESLGGTEGGDFAGAIRREELNEPDDYFAKTIYKKIFS